MRAWIRIAIGGFLIFGRYRLPHHGFHNATEASARNLNAGNIGIYVVGVLILALGAYQLYKNSLQPAEA